ncbi:MAG: hypothetical protein MK082_07280 [Phycisphaerales bacterium]|nr:hypothetical protein [Phycisphaerales bacterium]
MSRFLALVMSASLAGLGAHASADPPVNDACADALELEDGIHAFSTDDAETDGPDSSSCITFGSQQTWNDIWYRYTAPIDGILLISTCGTVDFDSRIAVYTGTCGDLQEHACNDDGAGCHGYSSYLLAHCVAGVEYLVRIGGYAEGATGSGTFGVKSVEPCVTTCLEGSDVEDEPCGGDTNSGCPDGSLQLLQSGVPMCGTWHVTGNFRDTDYYTIQVAEPGGLLQADLYSNDNVTGYIYLAKDSCPSHVLMYSYGGCPTPLRSSWLEPGSYRIIVAPGFEAQVACDDPMGANGYVLQVDVSDGGITVPGNDLCENAAVVSNGSWDFNTLLAETDGPDESPAECGAYSDGIGSDIWFSYTASCEGLVTASLCESADFDTRLEIWEGGCDGVLLACNDDGDDCSGYTSRVEFQGQCGVEYLVRVAGYDGAAGTGTLHLDCEGTCDCNGNGTSDQDELDLGSSTDCDLNGIPDECDLAGAGEAGDCDGDGVFDACQIMHGEADDIDADGILDVCQCELHPQACCPADIDGDGKVTGADLSLVLGAWGTSEESADLDSDGLVGGADLALVLGAWGDC